MSKDRSPWQNGHRAWQRLDGWHQNGPSAKPGHPDDGQSALDALGDVGLIRHLLDRAELEAVRTARRHRKSWAEIATMLGVTRQSAWERWRDLDDRASRPTSDEGSESEIALRVRGDAATELVEATRQTTERTPSIEPVAPDRRRRATTVVPDVTGMTWDDARHVLQNSGLVAVGPDPDGPPLGSLGWTDGTVTDQSPEAGATVPHGSSVTLWIERGGGSAGVREPRRPKPNPRVARAMRDEESNEAVG